MAKSTKTPAQKYVEKHGGTWVKEIEGTNVEVRPAKHKPKGK